MSKRHPIVICMFGPDGSGKSTLAKYIVAHLYSMGFHVSLSWIRGTHTFASILARFLRRFNVFQGVCNPYYGICIPCSMRFLWVWIEFVSILPIVLIRFVFPKFFKRNIVGERSLIDFLVWLFITLRWWRTFFNPVFKIVVSMTYYVCDYLIYVRADESILLARRKRTGEERFIPIELRVYDAIARVLKVPYIDTSIRSVSESFIEILKIIGDVNE